MSETPETPALVGWVDPARAVEEWADAPADEDVLTSYLLAAHEQCVAFLPHKRGDDGVQQPVIPDPVPESYALAQLLQARALYRSTRVGDGNQFGPDGLQVTVFPMDWTVKNLLRPRRVGRVL